jgi:hypothetical protein
VTELVIEASYLQLRTRADDAPPVRTVEVVENEILVDLLPDGSIYGIERIGGPVDASTLQLVLMAVPLKAA